MSPASYLTAPPRVAGASIASIAEMTTVIWGALAFFLVVLVAGSAAVGGFGLVLWRRVHVTLDNSSQVMGDLATGMETLDTRLGRIEGRTTELDHAASRLSLSLGRARILLAAAQESRDAIEGWLRFVPRA
jgi:hypothetical protein